MGRAPNHLGDECGTWYVQNEGCCENLPCRNWETAWLIVLNFGMWPGTRQLRCIQELSGGGGRLNTTRPVSIPQKRLGRLGLEFGVWLMNRSAKEFSRVERRAPAHLHIHFLYLRNDLADRVQIRHVLGDGSTNRSPQVIRGTLAPQGTCTVPSLHRTFYLM